MRIRYIAGWTAVVASLGYVGIKIVWLAGSLVGVRDLRGMTHAEWIGENVTTGLLGLSGTVVALVTVLPWGMRIPAWLLVVPMWVGAGLLAPFVVLMPLGALYAAAGWWTPPQAPGDDEPVLAGWVFVLVYGSFVVLGGALAVALAGYARAQWGDRFAGSIDAAPPSATHAAHMPLAWLAAAIAVAVAGPRLYWAAGGTAGLTDGARDVWLRSGDVVTAVQALAGAAALLVLVHRWAGRRRFVWPLLALWLGAGGMVASGFLAIPDLLTGSRWTPAGQSYEAYATSTFLTCLAGGLLSVLTVFLVVERSASLTGK